MRAVLLALRAGAVVAAFAFLTTLVVDGAPQAEPVRSTKQTAPAAPTQARKVTRAQRTGAAAEVLSIVAVGDIVMGSTPNLPPDGGRSFFRAVQGDLAGDVVLGNLEGTLSTKGSSKCGAGRSNCFAFRTPPAYAKWLVDAGFTVMNLANNHAFDFGRTGLRQTIAALDRVGLSHTGRPRQVTVQEVNGVRIAVLGFASYPWAQDLTDLAGARALVRGADAVADLVLVTMHAGAEGVDKQHVRAGTERYLGENRGDPVRFARAVVDAGADLVVGHGPHVLRGMEWYKGKLVAYSLGNFGGYGVFSLGGPLSTSCILRVELRGDGTFESGVVVPTRLVGKGVPALDPQERAHASIRTLSRQDFPSRAVEISPAGVIARPSR